MTTPSTGSSAWRALAAAPHRAAVLRATMVDEAAGAPVFDAVAAGAQRVLGGDGAFVVLLRDGVPRPVGASGLRVWGDDVEPLVHTTVEGVEPVAIEDLSGAGAESVRAYIGVPLILDGRTLGVLGVVCGSPRDWSEDDRFHLVNLAQWPVAELARIEATARLRVAESALTRATQVFDAMAEGVVGIDGEGNVALVNPAAAAMLGWAPTELIGKNLHAVAHHHRPDGSAYPLDRCPVLATLHDGQPRAQRHETFWRQDGSPLPVDMSVGRIVDPSGDNAAILVFDDITTRLRLEQSKDDFVSIVSHELRTPLAAVYGSLELLDDLGEDPEASTQMVAIARRNTERLTRLVDDILDLERAETGRLQLDRAPLHARDVMAAAADAVDGLARKARIEIVVEPTDAAFWGDERRVVQVITNLVSNAARFSPQDSQVVLRGHESDTEVTIDVVDSGPGIPEEDLERIFDRFWQSGATATTPAGRRGSGLGLAIAQSMARAHGGHVSVRSRVGAGSTFTLHLPRRARRAAVSVDLRSGSERLTGSEER